MIQIRPCTKDDVPALRRICLATSSIPSRTRAQKAFLYNMYCDYYAEQESSHCFAAVAGEGEVVGYILCAPDFKRYKKQFIKMQLPRFLRQCPLKAPQAFGEMGVQRPFAGTYPAHLHIDILEAYQRQGIGTRLMDALTAHLKPLGVPGVMLGVGASNEKGISFYRRYGFEVLRTLPGCVLMGLRLAEEE